MKITPIILNYNQPEIADKIYEKLKKDGFTEIISVDNGSDIQKPSQYSNFRLPKNIQAVGQIRMALIYCMDYFPGDYYWLISTSSELLDNVNYKASFEETLAELKKHEVSFGLLSPSIINNTVIKHQEYKANIKNSYSICPWCECIAPLVSHNLLEITRKNESCFFELKSQIGWGATHELGYEAANNELWWILSNKIPIKWNRNSGYISGAHQETLKIYQKKAVAEMKKLLRAKYGRKWKLNIYLNFLKKIKGKKFPFEVIPCDPFHIWKLFYIKLPKNKYLKIFTHKLFLR